MRSFSLGTTHWYRQTQKMAGVAVLLSLLGGCQLTTMAKFSYVNATSDHEWTGEAKRTRVPFKLVNNHIMVPVSINGSAPLDFVLDSGAAATVVTESHSTKSLALTLGDELPLSGAGSGFKSVANIVEDTDVAVSDLRLMEQSVIRISTAAMPFFDSMDEVYFDGVIGYDFFRRFIVDIDYDEMAVTFYEPSAFEPNRVMSGDDWQALPLDVESNMPYLTTKVTNTKNQKVDVKLLVDTGSTGSVSLAPASHPDLSAPQQYYVSTSQGLTGDTLSHLTVADSLEFGEYRLNQLLASYSITGEYGENDSNGILGNRALSRFNLIFDYTNERLWVKPNQRYTLPINADRSGLRVMPHDDGGLVKTVAEGTAGAKLGLQPGDIITHFNKMPVTASNLDALHRVLQSPEPMVSLCWRAAPEPRCGDLALSSRF